MEKVFIVFEQYTFEFTHDTRVSVYKNKERAIGAFNMIVNREKKDSWIATKKDVVSNQSEDSFNAYVDGESGEYETYIAVQEKEIW